jgi:hypothetical protein
VHHCDSDEVVATDKCTFGQTFGRYHCNNAFLVKHRPGCYTSGVTEQEIVDLFAKAAKPRLMDLLKLKVRHVYETTPGNAESTIVIDGNEIHFKSIRSTQPYREIERFVVEDKIIGFVVNPGLLPIVKAISMDIRGRKMLVTRRIQAGDDDKGVVAQLDHFGVRIVLNFDSVLNETQVVWEALYGFA